MIRKQSFDNRKLVYYKTVPDFLPRSFKTERGWMVRRQNNRSSFASTPPNYCSKFVDIFYIPVLAQKIVKDVLAPAHSHAVGAQRLAIVVEPLGGQRSRRFDTAPSRYE